MEQQIKKKILIVEDDDNMRSALTQHFSVGNFTVLSAQNGRIGLECALKEMPDIILLDVMMPELDGVTVMNTLRTANAWGKDVPIILLTSLFEEDDLMQKIKSASGDVRKYYSFKDGTSLAKVTEKVNRMLDPGASH